MKRSQMISKIHAKLHGIRPEINYAQQILDIIEEAGMVPPAFYHEVTTEQPDGGTNTQGKLINKWEAE